MNPGPTISNDFSWSTSLSISAIKNKTFVEPNTTVTTMCNPHGIDNILNKPVTQLGSISSIDTLFSKSNVQNDDEINSRIKREGNIPLLSNPDLSNGSEDSNKQHNTAQCWPEFQGILANQSLWRDRAYLQGKKFTNYVIRIIKLTG